MAYNVEKSDAEWREELSPEEQKSAGERIWKPLYQQNLIVNGSLRPDLEQALRTLAKPELAVVLVFGDDGAEAPSLAVRAGADPRNAVVASQRGDVVRFRLCPTSQLVATVMSLVPDCAPLKDFRPVTVPRGDAELTDEDQKRDREEVQRIEALPVLRTGFAQTIGRDAAVEIIGWNDTSEGRYVVYGQEHSEQFWDIYQAADNQQVGGVIANAIATVMG